MIFMMKIRFEQDMSVRIFSELYACFQVSGAVLSALDAVKKADNLIRFFKRLTL